MEEFRTGYGRDWLDFTMTLLDRYADVPNDLVGTPGELRAWLTGWGLAPTAAISTDDVERAQRLREALHAVARAAATEQSPDSNDVGVVETALRDDRPVRLRRSGGGLTVGRPASVREALARLARQATDDLTGPTPTRLRVCGDDECSGVFADPTGRRRGCSHHRWGVRARVRAHRARAKERSAANG
jgi:predicted RNA-binding Zn ribbon-like protein